MRALLYDAVYVSKERTPNRKGAGPAAATSHVIVYNHGVSQTQMEVLKKEIPDSLVVVLLVISVVGAAVGVAVTGILGEGSTGDTDRPLFIDSEDSGFVNTGNGLFQVSGDGSSAVIGGPVNRSESYSVTVALTTATETGIAARLLFENRTPLRINLTGGVNVESERVSQNEFLLEVNRGVEPGRNVYLSLNVSAPEGISPDFYTFESVIVPVNPAERRR